MSIRHGSIILRYVSPALRAAFERHRSLSATVERSKVDHPRPPKHVQTLSAAELVKAAVSTSRFDEIFPHLQSVPRSEVHGQTRGWIEELREARRTLQTIAQLNELRDTIRTVSRKVQSAQLNNNRALVVELLRGIVTYNDEAFDTNYTGTPRQSHSFWRLAYVETLIEALGEPEDWTLEARKTVLHLVGVLSRRAVAQQDYIRITERQNRFNDCLRAIFPETDISAGYVVDALEQFDQEGDIALQALPFWRLYTRAMPDYIPQLSFFGVSFYQALAEAFAQRGRVDVVREVINRVPLQHESYMWILRYYAIAATEAKDVAIAREVWIRFEMARQARSSMERTEGMEMATGDDMLPIWGYVLHTAYATGDMAMADEVIDDLAEHDRALVEIISWALPGLDGLELTQEVDRLMALGWLDGYGVAGKHLFRELADIYDEAIDRAFLSPNESSTDGFLHLLHQRMGHELARCQIGRMRRSAVKVFDTLLARAVEMDDDEEGRTLAYRIYLHSVVLDEALAEDRPPKRLPYPCTLRLCHVLRLYGHALPAQRIALSFASHLRAVMTEASTSLPPPSNHLQQANPEGDSSEQPPPDPEEDDETSAIPAKIDTLLEAAFGGRLLESLSASLYEDASIAGSEEEKRALFAGQCVEAHHLRSAVGLNPVRWLRSAYMKATKGEAGEDEAVERMWREMRFDEEGRRGSRRVVQSRARLVAEVEK